MVEALDQETLTGFATASCVKGLLKVQINFVNQFYFSSYLTELLIEFWDFLNSLREPSLNSQLVFLLFL